MKLCAIVCVWDDWEMLGYSLKNIAPLVDGIIVIYSEASNYGELSNVPAHCSWGHPPINFIQCEPNLKLRPDENERGKRNLGLIIAKAEGFTHFLMMDADEFYEPEPFLKEKQRFKNNPDLKGLICASQVYFKSPKLTIGLDTTRVTFIHKITPTLKFEFNRSFPYAFEGRDIRIDPTRMLNINSGVEWSDIIMKHYSWCRLDYEKKIRNSTARSNIKKSTIREDLEKAKPGYFCNFYKKELTACDDTFGLADLFSNEN